jgi:UDP-N-acetylglucosamine--N-acetylmuramyl-(pentapeptide) pyrophosphoryl-undecaprenol N-acetylglucosamine transferase
VADVIISRAGALSISEISVAGIPAIFVPSPNVVADHHTKNAASLVNNSAAKLVPDHEAEDTLVQQAIALLNNEEERKELSANIQKLAVNNSAEIIAEEIIHLIESSE